jgi:hypothetical protein
MARVVKSGPSGRRTSAEAIQRNRIASARRYHRNPERNRETQAQYRAEADAARPFIGWDGEGYDYFICSPDGTVEKGPQRTMLFGCSVPGRYIVPTDATPWLSTREMFDLILQVEAEFPDAFHVGFAFEYDVNQMLRDLPWRMLSVLKITGKVRWNGYRISHVPHKMFTVSKNGVAATIYDCFGYFHCKYTTALEKYHVGSSADNAIIAKGKSRRGNFTWADIEEVVTYWQTEISLLPPLMENIRTAAYNGGFRIHAWHGPGALASYALRYNGMRAYMSRNVPAYAKVAIRNAYAGGRFQAWQCGEYDGPIYTLDKNSAYVHAMAQLPNLAKGKWHRANPDNIRQPDDIARFGLYHILFDATEADRGKRRRASGNPERPYPLFHRDKTGKLTWPSRVDGWYWSPEARLVAGSRCAKFVEAIVFDDDGSYPFKWVEDAYETRRKLKEPEHYNPAEKAYKWALAAIYGSLARRVGWDRKLRCAPRSHELAWAGYITSHCRADIAIVADYAFSQGALISVDTDGVMATVPFPESVVDTAFGDGLGEWKEETFSGVLYWQNGIYWLRSEDGSDWSEAKSRGVPKGIIPLEAARLALDNASFQPPIVPAKIKLRKSRYVGYRQALNQQFKRWRVWQDEESEITFGGTGKGAHFPVFCRACKGATGVMHVVTHLQPKQVESEPHKLPWLETVPDDMAIGNIDIRGFMESETDVWRDQDLEDNL